MSDLTAIVCGGCGIQWAAPDAYLRARQEDGKTFYCPNGCARGYRDTVEQKLRRDRDRLAQENARLAEAAAAEQKRAAAAEARARSAETAAKRMRTRIQGGVCPDCNRTFADLARHMGTKHAHPAKPVLVAEVIPMPKRPRGRPRKQA